LGGEKMRNVIVLICMLMLGGALGQEIQGLWAGISAGYPGVNLHVGAEDILDLGGQALDVRGTAGFNYVGGGAAVISADGLFGLDVDTDLPINAYAGAGLTARIGSGFSLGIEGVAGVEYRLGDVGLPEGGVFFEVLPVLYIIPVNFDFNARLGFNYHF
jgi:hypothetical protein